MAARAERARVPGAAAVVGGRPGGRVVVRRAGRAPAGASAVGSGLAVGRSDVERSKVAAIQRSRILAAMVSAVDELGYAELSVASIVARSRVSRRTFYELFANREECLVAVLDDAVARVDGELEHAGVRGLPWRERVRAGLWAILSFLDREPALARVCVVQALGGGAEVRVRRERLLALLAAVVDEGRVEGGRECAALTAEGLVGAAFMIVYGRLANGGRVSGLLGELMGLILLPYLGPAAARREQARPTPALPPAGGPSQESPSVTAADPLQGIAIRLTYRTARVLEAVGEHPGASNRRVADLAGIEDPGQVSKLLRRLHGLGLLENHGGRAQGDPNQWRLTTNGGVLVESIRVHTAGRREAA